MNASVERILGVDEREQFRQNPIGFGFKEFYNRSAKKITLSAPEYLALARLEIGGDCSGRNGKGDRESLCSLCSKKLLVWYINNDIIITPVAYKWLCEKHDHVQRFIDHMAAYSIMDRDYQQVAEHHIRYTNIFQWALAWLSIAQLPALLTHDNSSVREMGTWLIDVLSVDAERGTCKDCFFRRTTHYATLCTHAKMVRTHYNTIDGGIGTYTSFGEDVLMHPIVSCEFGCNYYMNLKRIVSAIKNDKWLQVLRFWTTFEMYDVLYDRGVMPSCNILR